MVEKLSTKLINYEFITKIIYYLLDMDSSIELKTDSINTGIFSSFINSYLKSNDYLFKTTRDSLVVNNVDEYVNGEIYDWIIGMAKFIKEKNLTEEFKNFYKF